MSLRPVHVLVEPGQKHSLYWLFILELSAMGGAKLRGFEHKAYGAMSDEPGVDARLGQGIWLHTQVGRYDWINRGSGSNIRIVSAFTLGEECTNNGGASVWTCASSDPYATPDMDLDVDVRDSQNNLMTCAQGGQFGIAKSVIGGSAYEVIDCRGIQNLAPGPIAIRTIRYSWVKTSMMYGLAWQQY